MASNKKMKARTSAIEALENRTHLSSTSVIHHPITGKGAVVHEVAGVRFNSDPLSNGIILNPSGFGSVKLPNETGTLVATVHWGDGSQTTGEGIGNVNGTYSASDTSHIYSHAGNFKVTVDLAESDTGNIVGVIHGLAAVAKNVTAGRTIHTTAGTTFQKLIGIYDPFVAGADSTSSFTIDWGDQTANTSAKVVVHGKIATIYGTHQYSAAGTYHVQVFYQQPAVPVSSAPFLMPLPFTSTVIVKP